MIITLDIPKEIIVVNEVKLSVTSLNITTIDDGNKVTAIIKFNDSMIPKPKELILWEGQDYIDIDQWTDVDVDKRVKELL